MRLPVTIHYGLKKTITQKGGETVDLLAVSPEEFNKVRRSLVRTFCRKHNIRMQRRSKRHGRKAAAQKA